MRSPASGRAEAGARVVAGPAAGEPGPRTLQRPNVLLLYTDQQRRDSVGCYGSAFAATPHLDALAAGGRRFDRCYVQSPVCVPSRFAFLTGRYCSSTGVGSNGPEFPPDLTPVNRLLSPYGYHGAQIGKLHFMPHSNRDHRDPTPSYGFDTCIVSDEPGCYDDAYTRWVERVAPEQLARVRTALPPAAIDGPQDLPDFPAPGRNTHEPYLFEADEDLTHSAFVAAETCRFLDGIGDTPFLAIAGFYAPHPPINPPRRWVELLAERDLPLPKIGAGEKLTPAVAGLDAAARRRMVLYYHALVSHVDDQIGRILATLEATGLAERTIVIFTSDHGEYLGDHGRIQKGMPHSVITNVPCIVRLPGDPRAGEAVAEVVEQIDLTATILDFCGVQAPRFVQGCSLRPLLEGGSEWGKSAALTEAFADYGGSGSVTLQTERYLYGCDTGGRELLYDKREDPAELRDVVGDERYAAVRGELRHQLNVRLQQARFSARPRSARY